MSFVPKIIDTLSANLPVALSGIVDVVVILYVVELLYFTSYSLGSDSNARHVGGFGNTNPDLGNIGMFPLDSILLGVGITNGNSASMVYVNGE